MRSIEFPESNCVLTAPSDLPGCEDIDGYRDRDGVFITAWKLEEHELFELIKNGGVVYLSVWGVPPPVAIQVASPFVEKPVQ